MHKSQHKNTRNMKKEGNMHQGTQAVEGTVVSGPTLCCKERDPLPVVYSKSGSESTRPKVGTFLSSTIYPSPMRTINMKKIRLL
jgi:hypothetical protein